MKAQKQTGSPWLLYRNVELSEPEHPAESEHLSQSKHPPESEHSSEPEDLPQSEHLSEPELSTEIQSPSVTMADKDIDIVNDMRIPGLSTEQKLTSTNWAQWVASMKPLFRRSQTYLVMSEVFDHNRPIRGDTWSQRLRRQRQENGQISSSNKL